MTLNFIKNGPLKTGLASLLAGAWLAPGVAAQTAPTNRLALVGPGPVAAPTAGIIYGPVLNPLNGHEYFILGAGNWTNAQAAALALGGNLTTVRSAAEDFWIVTNLLVNLAPNGGPNLSGLPVWIGLYDPNGLRDPVLNDGYGRDSLHAANFVWADGETTTFRNWNTASGEPNNVGGREYFTAINWERAWGESNVCSAWNDTPLNGSIGYGAYPGALFVGGPTDGPYYGIAEVIPGPGNAAADTIQYTASETNLPAGSAVRFGAPGVDKAGHAITSWCWNFGDLSPADTNQNPVHAYAATNTCTPRLYAINRLGTPLSGAGACITAISAPVDCLNFVCPANLTVYGSAGSSCVLMSNYPPVYATNTCNPDDLTVSFDPPPGTCFPVGLTLPVRMTVAGSGQTDIGAFTVTALAPTNRP